MVILCQEIRDGIHCTFIFLCCCVVYCNTYTTINISRNIIKHNERTNTLLYKNINLSHFISKGWCLLCVRNEWRQMDCYIDFKFFFDHSSTSFSSWLGLLNHGSLRATKPSVCKLILTLASCLQLTQTVWAPGYIIV